MKATYILAFSILFSSVLYAQQPAKPDSIVPGKGSPEKQLKAIKQEKVKQLSDTIGNEPPKSALVDTTVQNKYGDLLRDDILFNRKYPQWVPLVEVAGTNAFVWAIERYGMNADFSKIGYGTWKFNLQKGWEWDTDRFGINFIGHPYSGTLT